MKILHVTDLHGDETKYRGIEDLALREAVGAVAATGDLLPHGKDLHKVQGEFIESVLAPHIARLGAAGISFLGILGNDDLRAMDAPFEKACGGSALGRSLAGKRVPLGGYEFIGFDLVVDYPFRLKDRCRRDADGFVFPPQRGAGIVSWPGGFVEMADWPAHALKLPSLEEELAGLPVAGDPARAVYLMHQPPAGVGLDICHGGKGVGSRAVHRFIQRVQPRLTLHGHIHESPDLSGVWCTRIGRTVVVQPGSREGLLGVLIDLENLSASVKLGRSSKKEVGS